MSATAVRRDAPLVASPVVTLRLLAMAEDAKHTVVDEHEQLVLPFEWAWSAAVKPTPKPAEPSPRPDPRHWGGRIALAAFEIMLGRRPAGQLSRLFDARTLHIIALHTNRYTMARRRRPTGPLLRPRVTSVRCFQPHPDAAEVTAVVHDGERPRALAMRMTARGNQWYITAFELG